MVAKQSLKMWPRCPRGNDGCSEPPAEAGAAAATAREEAAWPYTLNESRCVAPITSGRDGEATDSASSGVMSGGAAGRSVPNPRSP